MRGRHIEARVDELLAWRSGLKMESKTLCFLVVATHGPSEDTSSAEETFRLRGLFQNRAKLFNNEVTAATSRC